MNEAHPKYNRYLDISKDWPLDDWSITRECFDNIVQILPFGKTILELGSGAATGILSEFYHMISIESDRKWIGRHPSRYLHVPLAVTKSQTFGDTEWFDVGSLKRQLEYIDDYDLLLIDSGGERVGFYDHLYLFKRGIPIIFDDTMAPNYLRCAHLTAGKLKMAVKTVSCERNKHCTTWWNGKRYTLLLPIK
jgi:hypothetical protein